MALFCCCAVNFLWHGLHNISQFFCLFGFASLSKFLMHFSCVQLEDNISVEKCMLFFSRRMWLTSKLLDGFERTFFRTLMAISNFSLYYFLKSGFQFFRQCSTFELNPHSAVCFPMFFPKEPIYFPFFLLIFGSPEGGFRLQPPFCFWFGLIDVWQLVHKNARISNNSTMKSVHAWFTFRNSDQCL